MSRTGRARRALVMIAATALALTGLVAPATAAGTGTLSGTLSAPAGVKRTGYVDLFRWSTSLNEWSHITYVYVGPDGAYTFAGIEAGAEYTLAFEPDGRGSQGYAPNQVLGGTAYHAGTKLPGQLIKGTAGPQTVNFALAPGVEVKGKVNAPSGLSGSVTVALYQAEDFRMGGIDFMFGAIAIDEVALGADGSYRFPHVMSGLQYSVAVRGSSTAGPLDHEPVTVTGSGFPSSSAALRLVSGPTTLPTVRMRSTVPASGKILAPDGLPFTGGTVTLWETSASGYAGEVASVPLPPDGVVNFPQGVFPGRSYTLEAVSATGSSTYLGMAASVDDALSRTAGTSGLTFPDMPLIVFSGPDRTPWVDFDWPPLLRGAPVVGETLSLRGPGGQLGGTSETPGATITYRWLHNDEFIPGATGPQYTLTEADRNKFISVRMTVRAPGHRTDYFLSQEMLVESGRAPYATSYPVVSGTAKVGGRLSVSRGAWSVPGVSLAYQWLRDGAAVPGATSASYAPVPADLGKQLSVQITASAPGRVAGVSITAPYAKVTKGDAASAKKKPKIKGKKRVGKKLRVTRGKWSLSGVRISYQWLRDGKKIKKKAKKRTYKLTKKDRGKRISVRVTVKKAGYENAKVVTKQTKKIKAKAKKKKR